VAPSGEKVGALSHAGFASVKQTAACDPSVGTAHRSQSVDQASSEPSTTFALYTSQESSGEIV
jgi:hypothetical protein